MGLHFTYNLTGAGWVVAFIKNDCRKLEMRVSYLNDTLLELVTAVNRVVFDDANSADVVFMDEPGEHKLVISKLNNESLELEFFWSEDWVSWGILKEDSFKSVFKTITDSATFAKLTLEILESILRKYGEQGYKEKWIEHDFPKEEYVRLKRNLAA